jgi:hypothetical protein
VRGFAAGAKPTTGGESVDSSRIGGELPDVKTRADPVRGFAVGAKPTTGGESVDSPRIGGELPDAKTRTGRRSLS